MRNYFGTLSVATALTGTITGGILWFVASPAHAQCWEIIRICVTVFGLTVCTNVELCF